MTEAFRTIESDVLVIGGGGAGTRAAIEAARHGANVLLVSKGLIGRSGLSVMGGGGLAVVTGNEPKDSPEVHFRDTVTLGHYLNDQNLVDVLVNEAPQRAWKELHEWGARGPVSHYLHKVGHSYQRGLFIRGHTVMTALRRELPRHSNVRVIEDCIVTKLVTYDGKIAGATGLNIRNGEFMVFKTKSVVLATGGLGSLYSLSTNSPHGLAGDSVGTGISLAYRAGAELVDMEMVQFYPGVIIHPAIARGILFPYEIAVAMLDGKICNVKGEEFLHKQPLVRDIMTKRMYEEIRAGRCSEHGGVYLDITTARLSKDEKEKTLRKWMSTYEHSKLLGIDFTKQPIEIRPAAHFACGGVRINEKAETNLPGLYAAGEVDGNAHGANRLAGNAFAEFLVFGARAGKYSAEYAKTTEILGIEKREIKEEYDRISGFLEPEQDGIRPIELKTKIQKIMDKCVGPLRSKQSLERGIISIISLKKNDLPRIQAVDIKGFNLEWVEAIEVSLMLDVAEIISKSALLRDESRGVHQREDYPEKDNRNWLRHTIISLEKGAMKPTTAPVIITKPKPSEELK